MIRHFIRNPRRLFLADGLGALLTAFFLCGVLRPFERYFGMPAPILLWLAAIAGLFCAYSMSCFFFLKKNHALFIRTIGMANLLYCATTAGLVWSRLPILSPMGIAYFTAEIALVCGLVYVELRVAAALAKAPATNT